MIAMVVGYLEIKAVKNPGLEHYVWNVICIISKARDILQRVTKVVKYARNFMLNLYSNFYLQLS